jgi:hypothetical protein
VSEPELTVVSATAMVWRVGFKPEPWGWAGWEWATDGRFHGRWDDVAGVFRTVYAGSTLRACLLEVLAVFRPDGTLVTALNDIDEDPDDAVLHPTSTPGQVPYAWLEPRTAASARLTGSFCAVSTVARSPRCAQSSLAKRCGWAWATSTPPLSKTAGHAS